MMIVQNSLSTKTDAAFLVLLSPAETITTSSSSLVPVLLQPFLADRSPHDSHNSDEPLALALAVPLHFHSTLQIPHIHHCWYTPAVVDPNALVPSFELNSACCTGNSPLRFENSQLLYHTEPPSMLAYDHILAQKRKVETVRLGNLQAIVDAEYTKPGRAASDPC